MNFNGYMLFRIMVLLRSVLKRFRLRIIVQQRRVDQDTSQTNASQPGAISRVCTLACRAGDFSKVFRETNNEYKTFNIYTFIVVFLNSKNRVQ